MRPTWKDVNVPQSLVNSIKALPACYMLDCLTHQFVGRNRRKPHYTYHCAQCDYHYKPEKSADEVNECPNCNCKVLTGEPQLRWGKEIPCYSRRHNVSLKNVIDNFYKNYVYYFGRHPADFNCGWDRHLYVEFPEGEKIKGDSARLCIVKAAILCPFLWDMRFDWKWEPWQDTMNTEHVSPILHGFFQKQWIGKPE